MKRFFFILSMALMLFFLPGRNQAFADEYHPMDPEILKEHITTFLGGGAQGYLLWMYSGPYPGTGPHFENGPNSFFRNDPEGKGEAICAALKEMSDKYTPEGKFVGVNIYSLGQEQIDDHLQWLRTSCGVTVVRVFAWAGGVKGVKKSLAAAADADIKLIFAIGDYSNGQGGMGAGDNSFYDSDQKEYLEFVREVVSATKGHPALYGLELANEPHCGSEAQYISSYNKWVTNTSALISQTEIANIGIGQMANNEQSACDNPTLGVTGSGNFYDSNNRKTTNITMTSAHYYNQTQFDGALAALQESIALGQPFYIGEAGWDEDFKLKPDEFYLYPIKGLHSGNAGKFYQDLIDQRYESQCAPQITIKGGLVGLEEKLKPQIAEDQSLTVGDAEFTADYTKSEIPILRSSLEKLDERDLFTDIQGHLGHRNVTIDDEFLKDTASAPIFALTTLKQQCKLQLHLLETVQTMCSKLQDPNKCALDEAIPGTESIRNPGQEFTYLELLQAIQTIPDLNYDEGLLCEQILSKEISNRTQTEQKIIESLNKVPFYLNKAYRLGFVVFVAEQVGPVNPLTNFNFFGLGNSDPLSKHEVRIVAFKIPDFSTNKDSSSDIYYQDGSDLTRSMLTSLDTQEYFALVDEQTKQNANPGLGSPAIDCSQSELCQDGTIFKSLVDFVNNYTQDTTMCTTDPNDMPFEEVKDIYSLGVLTEDNEGSNQNLGDEQGNVNESLQENFIAEALESDNTTDNSEEETAGEEEQQSSGQKSKNSLAFKFMSIFGIKKEGPNPNQTKIQVYLVAPHGTDIERTSKMMMPLIYNEQQIAQIFNTPYEEQSDEYQYEPYFKLQVPQTFPEAESGKYVTYDYDCLAASSIPQDPKCERAITASVKAVDEIGADDAELEDKEPRVLGGRLGFMLRKIQASLYAHSSDVYDYLSSCQSTEEFFKGTCRGGAMDEEDQVIADESSCDLYRSQTVDLPDLGELYDTTCEVATEITQRVGRPEERDLMAHFLWGAMWVDGSPFLRKIRAGETSTSCEELIKTHCGTVQITGITLAACMQPSCPNFINIGGDVDGDIEAKPPEEICSIEGSLMWTARARINETNFLKERQKTKLDSMGNPYTQNSLEGMIDFYKMMAWRNYGASPEDLASIEPCSNTPAISGCASQNYCDCTIDDTVLPFRCNDLVLRQAIIDQNRMDPEINTARFSPIYPSK